MKHTAKPKKRSTVLYTQKQKNRKADTCKTNTNNHAEK